MGLVITTSYIVADVADPRPVTEFTVAFESDIVKSVVVTSVLGTALFNVNTNVLVDHVTGDKAVDAGALNEFTPALALVSYVTVSLA